MKTELMDLKKRFGLLELDYIDAFNKAYDVECEQSAAGFEVADMMLTFDDIRYCVDNAISFNTLYSWYWLAITMLEENNAYYSNLSDYVKFTESVTELEEETEDEYYNRVESEFEAKIKSEIHF